MRAEKGCQMGWIGSAVLRSGILRRIFSCLLEKGVESKKNALYAKKYD